MSDFKHKKKFGQNFLTHQNEVLEKIMEVSNVTSEDTVIEIGPGEGALTELLLDSSKKLFCFEIDRDLEKILNKKFKDNSKFNLKMGDVLEADLKEILKDDKKLFDISQSAYKIVVKNHTWENRVDTMLEMVNLSKLMDK